MLKRLNKKNSSCLSKRTLKKKEKRSNFHKGFYKCCTNFALFKSRQKYKMALRTVFAIRSSLNVLIKTECNPNTYVQCRYFVAIAYAVWSRQVFLVFVCPTKPSCLNGVGSVVHETLNFDVNLVSTDRIL